MPIGAWRREPHREHYAADMAADIVPIELSLTAGDLVTLWAPPWRADGEEWEAYLGDDDNLFAFADVASLAGFVRTATDHDLVDHPAWPLVPELPALALRPDESHRYDLVGVPEMVAQEPDTWVIADLADVVTVLRSLAEVCDLDVVREMLTSAPGFDMLDSGTYAFSGRDGKRRWEELGTVVAQRWEEVLDALDWLVRTPEVAPDAVAVAEAELADTPSDESVSAAPASSAPAGDTATSGAAAGPAARAATTAETSAALAFWADVGIDPIRIVSGRGEHYTLRCYVDDEPVFLGSDGRIDVFDTPAALAGYLATRPNDHDLATVSTWDRVMKQAQANELGIAVDSGNSYLLDGLADDLAGGPGSVDAVQLDLAVELLTDAEQWAGSDSAERALAESEPLGWLVSFILRPDPTRLAPSPPFDAEVDAWRTLINTLESHLHVR